MTEVETRVQHVVSTGDLGTMMHLVGRGAQETAAAAPGGEQDLQAACDMPMKF